ncbi:MAG: hypothetical protein ACRDJW_09040 [Thermomicrobiales bacterium]
MTTATFIGSSVAKSARIVPQRVAWRVADQAQAAAVAGDVERQRLPALLGTRHPGRGQQRRRPDQRPATAQYAPPIHRRHRSWLHLGLLDVTSVASGVSTTPYADGSANACARHRQI